MKANEGSVAGLQQFQNYKLVDVILKYWWGNLHSLIFSFPSIPHVYFAYTWSKQGRRLHTQTEDWWSIETAKVGQMVKDRIWGGDGYLASSHPPILPLPFVLFWFPRIHLALVVASQRPAVKDLRPYMCLRWWNFVLLTLDWISSSSLCSSQVWRLQVGVQARTWKSFQNKMEPSCSDHVTHKKMYFFTWAH